MRPRSLGRCCVLSKDRSVVQPNPRELAVDLNDLRSRLNSAVAVHTDWLSDQEKLQALQRRAKFRGFTLDDDVGHFLLDRLPRNMGSLMEILGRIELETMNQQRKATIPLVKRMLGL